MRCEIGRENKDLKEVEFEDGDTIAEVARDNGVTIEDDDIIHNAEADRMMPDSPARRGQAYTISGNGQNNA